MVVGAGKGEMVSEDLVAPSPNRGVLPVGFLWSCASLLPLCVGWDALLLRTNAAHSNHFRRMPTHSFPVIHQIGDIFARSLTPCYTVALEMRNYLPSASFHVEACAARS